MDRIHGASAMTMLSVIIPARNEEWLQKTIECVLDAAVEDIEVIAILDGYWPDPPLKDDPRVVVIRHPEARGQRRSINEGAKIARGEYIMKLDAHCSVGPGFDKVLKEDCEYEWTMVPRMYNLDIKTFQPKLIDNPETALRRAKAHDYMYIGGPAVDAERWTLRAMYFGKYAGVVAARPKSNDKLVDETMACMGPGWFMHKDRFWEQGGCDEGHGGWGQQGVEVSLKAWLSGGALMVNKKTWFAHWFRGSGIGFPYPISKSDTNRAREYSQDFWMNGKWDKQVRPIEWLVEKFNPPTWETPCELSVIIPSYKDPYLHTTIGSILANFEGDYEIIPVIDGYELEQPLITHDKVRPVYLPETVGMRGAINAGVRAARGKYIMRTDEHCMFCQGFDKRILEDIQDNHIVTARRYFLDPVKWEVMEDEGHVDFEKLIVNRDPKKFSSYPWKSRDKEKEDVLYDETMAMQGSMWAMPKAWWRKVIGELQTEGYGPHYQDSTEMQFKTWKAGGKLMLTKKAWYAHKHRSFPRTHGYSREKAKFEWLYALNKWYPEYQEARQRMGV